MIDDKKIEEAASVYGESNDYSVVGPDGRMSLKPELETAFETGVHWAINEFLQDLWHKASETPDLNRRILYEYKPNGEINPPTHIREATYEKIRWKECGYKPINLERIITRWLYIDDLFKKEGGEQ